MDKDDTAGDNNVDKGDDEKACVSCTTTNSSNNGSTEQGEMSILPCFFFLRAVFCGILRDIVFLMAVEAVNHRQTCGGKRVGRTLFKITKETTKPGVIRYYCSVLLPLLLGTVSG